MYLINAAADSVPSIVSTGVFPTAPAACHSLGNRRSRRFRPILPDNHRSDAPVLQILPAGVP